MNSTARYVILAHIEYRNTSGQVIRKQETVLARCFTYKEAEAERNAIRTTDRTQYVPHQGPNAPHVIGTGFAQMFTGWTKGSESITEHITKLQIITKKKYNERLIRLND